MFNNDYTQNNTILEKLKSNNANVSPISIKMLNQIIDQAEEDARNGRLIPISKLKDEVESWT